MIRTKIEPQHSQMPLEAYLIRVLELGPRAAIKRAFSDGLILLNGKPASRLSPLHAGDQLEVRSEKIFSSSELQIIPNEELALQPLLETPELIVVQKPAGMNAHPLRPDEAHTVLNALAAMYPETADRFEGAKPLEGALVHRLDRGTSGLLVCARTAASYQKLRALWRARAVEKVYLTWLLGKPAATHARGGRISLHLSHDPKSKKRMLVQTSPPKDLTSWEAQSAFRFLKSIDLPGTGLSATLALVQIHTGVMHQIRATAAALGHPVLSDVTYEAARNRLALPGLALDSHLTASQTALFDRLEGEIGALYPHAIPKLAALPEEGFFLHALWLRCAEYEPLARGVLSPLPEYFTSS